MTEEPANPALAPSAAPRATGPTPGELLRGEREQQRLSLQQVAEDLHLDARLVEALEEDRFAVLGAPVYARGHLRKYASVLGLEPAQVLERYEALSDRPEVPTPVPATTVTPLAPPRPSLTGPLILLAALVALAIGWWIFSSGDADDAPLPAAVLDQPAPLPEQGAAATSPTTPEADEPVQMPPAQPTTTQPVADPAPTAADAAAPATAPPAQAQPAATIATPASAPVATTGQIRVQLDYSDACWTEIHDAQGRQLAFGLGSAGDSRIVVGAAPLRVTLGLASAVSLQVDGRAVVIPRQAGRNASYFTLAGDGTAQLIR